MEDPSLWPLWLTALCIFALRVIDVSLGTLRTIAVVHGRISASVVLGFVEILIWVTAVSWVVANLHRSPLLLVAYAGGFAGGNAAGILLERRAVWGTVMLRFLSSRAAPAIVRCLHDRGQWAAVFDGVGADGQESIVFASCPKPMLHDVLDAVRRLDPDVVYSVEPVLESGPPLPGLGGWRARLLRK